MDRRRFLTAALGALAGSVAACTERSGTLPSAQPTSPVPATSPSSNPTPTPSPTLTPSSTPPPTVEAATPDATAPPTRPPSALELAVICRSAWGAQAAGQLTPHAVERLTLHHTAVLLEDNRDAPGRLRRHQEHHQSLGWPDIAYHLAVDRHGHVYELRRPDTAGDTGTDYDPSGHFLVVALGDYTRQEPTPAQLDAIARVFAWGAITFEVQPDSLTGHRDHARTACPGGALQRRIPELRGRISELAAAGVARRDVCGDAGAELVAAIAAGEDEPLGG